MEFTNNRDLKVLIVGAGYMATEYAKILISRGISFSCVGKSESGCNTFFSTTGVQAISGGILNYLKRDKSVFTHAIVCTNIEELSNTVELLLDRKILNILVEKPGGINAYELETVWKKSSKIGAKVYVAYNRRFYASVKEAAQIIQEDGGVLSFNFEFTEWSHLISKLDKSEEVKNAWLIANSSHVIDLAFFIGGIPKEMKAWACGQTDWNNGNAVYAGAGISETGALFTYNANWIAPGRWGVEWLTTKHRIILKPLEELRIQEIGSIEITKVDIDNKFDCEYKPGLYEQVESFLNNNDSNILKTIELQLKMWKYYEKIRKGE